MIVFTVPTMVASFDYGNYSSMDAAQAVALCLALGTVVGYFTYRQKEHGSFLLQLFAWGLLLRILVATGIFAFNTQEFFGGDAVTYDMFGFAQMKAWEGDAYYQVISDRFVSGGAAAWGMIKMIAAVYWLIGRNTLAVQFINSIIGSATAILVFNCAQHVYRNVSVARIAAICVAFFPSLVLWSAQGLKDAPIVFFLVLAVFASLKLSEKFSLKFAIILVASLFFILSLRFYVFYMICVAIAGGFIIGMQKITPTNFVRQFVVLLILGVSLTYLGVTRYANSQLETFGSLQAMQRSRLDLSTRAESGFGREVDVSTTEGAISTIPLGLVYLLFAPFPWQLVLGIWYSIKYRLRQMSPILIFTTMLSVAYSIFQGNVGTAYRQRAQLLVFYLMFVAVGFVLVKEKREDRARVRQQLSDNRTQRFTSPIPPRLNT
jgi:hypothetical protein